MASSESLLLFFLILSSWIIISEAQEERSPHGLQSESPLVLSPEAYNFFHPDAQPQAGKWPCSSSDCSTLPEAATVQATPAHESMSDEGRKHLGAKSIASIPTGFVFALILGFCVYYVVATRRSNAARAKAAHQLQPDV